MRSMSHLIDDITLLPDYDQPGDLRSKVWDTMSYVDVIGPSINNDTFDECVKGVLAAMFEAQKTSESA